MKALVLEEKQKLSLRDFPIEREEVLGPRDVRIKLHTVGICGSDVHYYTHGGAGLFQVKAPMILGHEASGIVIETGAEVHIAEGRRPRLHGAGHPRPQQPRDAPRPLQRRSGGALLGDAADPRRPAPDRRPSRDLHLQAARQRLLRRGRDGRAAGRRRPRAPPRRRSSPATSPRDRRRPDRPRHRAVGARRRLRPGLRLRRRRGQARARRDARRRSRRSTSRAQDLAQEDPRRHRRLGRRRSCSNAPATRAAPQGVFDPLCPGRPRRLHRRADASRSTTTSARRWCARRASSTSSATPTSSRAASPCCRRARST